MIIRSVRLQNFGIYSEPDPFDLIPNGDDRPVILLQGKNGAGKTTFIEAIKLGLNGSLALGSRVSRAAYEQHLINRIHKPRNPKTVETSTRIEIVLEYVSEGRQHTYCVSRSWSLKKERLKEYLEIWQDDELISKAMKPAQKESFLREIVPPYVADLFFFDGEKLQLLIEDETSNHRLAEIIKRLFGLDLIERLQKDLDIYLSQEIDDQDVKALSMELQEATKQISQLEERLSELYAERETNQQTLATIAEQIETQEQKIASEGKWFADQSNALNIKRQQLEGKIASHRHKAQELCNGLMPFAISAQIGQLLKNRLLLEEQYERATASREMISRQLSRLSDEMMTDQFWSDLDIMKENGMRQKFLSKIEAVLKEEFTSSDIQSEDVILQVSGPDRQTLLSWLDQSATEVPRQFCQSIEIIKELESELETVENELNLVPDDQTLEPLVKALHQYNQEFGRLTQIENDLNEVIAQTGYAFEEANFRLKRVRESIAQQKQSDNRVQMVIKTQRMLEEYIKELTKEKLAIFEKEVMNRFNALCRKSFLIDRVSVDPETFKITLYRQEQIFDRSQLSAGEKQLFAIAMMWALRQVSEVPMPVIIDTPMGRLDSEHRLSMVQDYFPKASHQVVLLATDSEIDDKMLIELESAISQIYHLEYDTANGHTTVMTPAQQLSLWNKVTS